MFKSLQRISRLAALAVMLLVPGISLATPVLDVDFRDGSIWGGHGGTEYSYGGITITSAPDLLYRDNTDGYGVMGGEYDEIDREELLTIWFDESFFSDSNNLLTGVLLTDLFPANDGGPMGESGWVTLYDAGNNVIAQFFVNATPELYHPNGEVYVDFGGEFAPDRIEFTAYVDPATGAYTGSEFSVAGFTTVSVPEPGTLALLGIGLLMVAFSRRRRPASIDKH